MCIYQWVWRQVGDVQKENLTLRSIKAFPAVLALGTTEIRRRLSYRTVSTAQPWVLKRKKIASYIPLNMSMIPSLLKHNKMRIISGFSRVKTQ